MKKTYYFIFILFSFFVFNLNTEAKTISGYVDENEKGNFINVFYELKNSSALGKYLIEQQDGLMDTLISLKPTDVKIYDKSQFSISLFYHNSYFDNLVRNVIANNNYYVNTEYFNSLDYEYIIVLNDKSLFRNIVAQGNGYAIDYCTGGHIYYLFDSDMKLAGVVYDSQFNNYSSYDKINIGLGEKRNITLTKNAYSLTPYFSLLYYVNFDFMIYNDYKLTFDYFITDNNKVLLVENLGWFKSLITTYNSYFDEERTYNFDYYATNPVLSNNVEFKSLSDVIFKFDSLDIPSNFKSVNLSDYRYGYYFYPTKSTYNNYFDTAFYFYKTIQEQSIMLGVFTYEDSYLNLVDNYFNSVNGSRPYKVSGLVDEIYESGSGNKYPKYVYQMYSSNTKHDLIFYYNPDYYDVVAANNNSFVKSVNGVDVNFGNVSNNANLIYKDIVNDICQGDSNLCENIINGSSSTSSNNSNSNGSNISVGSISDFIKTFSSSISNVTGSFSALMSCMTTFLNNLPPEVKATLYFAFFTGVLIIILKLIF